MVVIRVWYVSLWVSDVITVTADICWLDVPDHFRLRVTNCARWIHLLSCRYLCPTLQKTVGGFSLICCWTTDAWESRESCQAYLSRILIVLQCVVNLLCQRKYLRNLCHLKSANPFISIVRFGNPCIKKNLL